MSKLTLKRKKRERRQANPSRERPDSAQTTPGDALAELKARFEREQVALLELFNARQLEEAVSEGDKFIQRWPSHAFGYKLSGAACCELKSYEEARDRLMKAVELNPADGETFGNLGVALLSIHDYAGAKEALLEARKLLPEDSRIYARLGYVYFREGQHEIARHVLERALALDPDRAEAHKVMGDTLKALKEPELAIAHLERAVELRPNFWPAMVNLAVLLDDNDGSDRALELYDQVMVQNPQVPGLFANRGNSLIKKGRFDEAKASFLRAQEVDPDNAEAFRQLALAGSYTPDDAIVDHMAERFADDTVETGDRVLIGFGLGTLHDKAGEHERAFFHFERANALHRSTLDYSLAGEARLMERIAEVCDAGYFAGLELELAELAERPEPESEPVFVIGMPRSGSTLVEQIISSHGQVAGAGEVLFMQKIVDMLTRESLKPFPETLLMFKEETAGILASRYLEMLHERVGSGHRWITDKLLYNFLYIGLIQRMFPRARIVHVRRNPLDCCLSMYFLKFSSGQNYAYDQVELGRYFRLYENLMQHWQQVLPGRIHEVQYEDLVADIEGETRRILDHCGMPFDPACLEFHKSKRDVATASSSQVRKKLYTRAVSRSEPYRPWLSPLIEALDAPPIRSSEVTAGILGQKQALFSP